MLESLFRRYVDQLGRRSVSERAAGRGDNQFANRIALTQHALPDCRRLTINRQDLVVVAARHLHNLLARHDQNLFVGQSYSLASLKGPHGWQKPG